MTVVNSVPKSSSSAHSPNLRSIKNQPLKSVTQLDRRFVHDYCVGDDHLHCVIELFVL